MDINQTKSSNIRALLLSSTAPSDKQKEKLLAFLENKYKGPVSFSFKEDKSIKSGFRLEIMKGGSTTPSEVFDWSATGQAQRLKKELLKLKTSGNIIPLIKDTFNIWSQSGGDSSSEEIGTVLTVGDGIATVSGLFGACYGELLCFESGVLGMVQELKKDYIGCILFGDDTEVFEGSPVFRTKKSAGVPVGNGFIGRVVDSLGNPIDNKGEIEADAYFPIENPAPAIIDRQPVNEPLETGILAIDSMFPIGKGQRELIIGDRQTGKTAIALDTILNQKGKDVICIYVSIGQKASSVAQLTETLKKHDAIDYSVVVCATASDSAPLQYIAPYAGCALAEYFMKQGKDILIVYDDLSKHAIAYRTMSLLLERSPGREAYPGDVFYLHSRLLERSAHLSDELGGGSITALPIVETQAGDVSAYIPTNIISITDGQIFLESNLFFAGQRPAINVGLSVSRVGGAAQSKAMKKAAGTIRLSLAQYREIEVFTQFASDLDNATREQLSFGQGLMQLLKQEQYCPKRQWEQVITLIVALNHLYRGVPVHDISRLNTELLSYIKKKLPDVCADITKNGALSENSEAMVIETAKLYIKEALKQGK